VRLSVYYPFLRFKTEKCGSKRDQLRYISMDLTLTQPDLSALVYLSLPQGTLEKLKIVAGEKGLAVEQVVQEAIDEFLERPTLQRCETRDSSIACGRLIESPSWHCNPFHAGCSPQQGGFLFRPCAAVTPR
jgi:hypothetical protein